MLVVATELLDSLTQSSYKRQEINRAESTDYSNALNRVIAMLCHYLQLLVNFLNLV